MASRQNPVKLTARDGQTYRYAGKWRYVVLAVPGEGKGPVRRLKATGNLRTAVRVCANAYLRDHALTSLYDTWATPPRRINPWRGAL